MIDTEVVDAGPDNSYSGLEHLRDAALNRSLVSIGNRRTDSPHEFYRYPARFPPGIAAAAISAFTLPGETVADYFVGGGTTLVEARNSGRLGIGSDLNSLAVFVSRAKTTPYPNHTLDEVREWCASRSFTTPGVGNSFSAVRHASDPRWSELVEIVSSAVESLKLLRDPRAEILARTVILRAAQWALDMREEIPGPDQFTEVLSTLGQQIPEAAALSTRRYRASDRANPSSGVRRTLVLEAGLPGVSQHSQIVGREKPALVLTSPPYPGVYMNYHRWKIQGRLESSLPYFIAGLPEPQGRSFYTMSARSDRTQNLYFAKLALAYQDIRSMMGEHTWLVQVVGFSDVELQLPRFLSTMSEVGLREATFPECATEEDGRLWRAIPRRRWWARAGDRLGVAEDTATEVVLFHQIDLGRTRAPRQPRALRLPAA